MKKNLRVVLIIIVSLMIVGIISSIVLYNINDEEIMYTITYDYLNKTETIKEGELLSKLPIPTKDGYEFLGWFTDIIDGNKIENNTKVEKNMTLYARWEKIKNLEIHFMKADVYYDDAILIRSNDTTIFIDGGRGYNSVIEYLDDLSITDIDYVIGSHTEYDHIDAQSLIIDKYNVKNVIYPNDIYNCGCRCDNKDVGKVKKSLDNKNIKATVQSVPSKLDIGDISLYFLAPFALYCNKNNNSFVFILKYYDNTFMFTGDADSAMHNYNKLNENAKKLGLSSAKVDVVKYPHHGNETLDNNFIDSVGAKYFIVPNSKFPRFPTKDNLNKLKNKGIEVYRQSDSKTGNILITSNGKDINFTMDINSKDLRNN